MRRVQPVLPELTVQLGLLVLPVLQVLPAQPVLPELTEQLARLARPVLLELLVPRELQAQLGRPVRPGRRRRRISRRFTTRRRRRFSRTRR